MNAYIFGLSVCVFSIIFLSVPASCFCDEEGYVSYEKRDPFVPLIGVKGTGESGSEKDLFTIDDVVFQGVVFDDKGDKNVIINGELMRVGDKINEIEIEDIGEEYVSVRIGEETHKIKLYE